MPMPSLTTIVDMGEEPSPSKPIPVPFRERWAWARRTTPIKWGRASVIAGLVTAIGNLAWIWVLAGKPASLSAFQEETQLWEYLVPALLSLGVWFATPFTVLLWNGVFGRAGVLDERLKTEMRRNSRLRSMVEANIHSQRAAYDALMRVYRAGKKLRSRDPDEVEPDGAAEWLEEHAAWENALEQEVRPLVKAHEWERITEPTEYHGPLVVAPHNVNLYRIRNNDLSFRLGRILGLAQSEYHPPNAHFSSDDLHSVGIETPRA